MSYELNIIYMRLQRTIKKAVILEGRGIHSGNDVRLIIKRAPVDTGVIFIRSDIKEKPAIAAHVSNLADYSGDLRCTSIEKNGMSVNTIEHLMAALSSLNIDNTEIEIDNQELPSLGGSALDYALGLQRGEGVDQRKERRELFLQNPIWCCEGVALLIAIPNENLRISYFLNYDSAGYMRQYADFTFDSDQKKEDIFIKEIAPARTYCLESEVAHILKKGLGKGGNYKNTLVLRNGEPIENEFRFTNEPARHKIVDLLGDLALLNVGVKAHIIGIRSGHSLNARLLRELEKLL